jgi:quercetin dioxygenase-like cupin family protein
VERFAFDAAAFVPQQEALERVTVAPLTKAGPVQAAVFRIAPGGCSGRHPTTVPQILAVLEGSGEVSGADGVREPIRAGEAVYWTESDEHETRTDVGLTALVLEGDGLDPLHTPDDQAGPA